MEDLKGKVILVTGASQGIGLATVKKFKYYGACIIATARNVDSLKAIEDENLRAFPLDVSKESEWINLITYIKNSYGHLDVLVNNAGIISYNDIQNSTVDDWNNVLSTNLTGTWLGMKHAIKLMIESKVSGSIINVSSIWGNVAVEGACAYHASKGGIRNLTKNAAISYAKNSIRVNSLHPGFILTPLTTNQNQEINNIVIAKTPLGRAGNPDEIANGIAFLASELSSFMTGSELVIDGGYLAQ